MIIRHGKMNNNKGKKKSAIDLIADFFMSCRNKLGRLLSSSGLTGGSNIKVLLQEFLYRILGFRGGKLEEPLEKQRCP